VSRAKSKSGFCFELELLNFELDLPPPNFRWQGQA
jgi:hypothetical protein